MMMMRRPQKVGSSLVSTYPIRSMIRADTFRFSQFLFNLCDQVVRQMLQHHGDILNHTASHNMSDSPSGVLFLFATSTGTASDVAHQLHFQCIRSGINSDCASIDSYHAGEPPSSLFNSLCVESRVLIFVVST